jgi:hypothetical protein
MKPHVYVIPFLALTVLAGCFMSTEPRIEIGAALAEGPVAFCMPDEQPCQIGQPEGDGYLVKAEEEDEEDVRLRFEPLIEVDGATIYLGESELREDQEVAWSYIVARADGETPEGLKRFTIMMPGCSDMDAEQRERFKIEKADSYTCMVDDIANFRAYLIEAYTEQFADPTWWADEN